MKQPAGGPTERSNKRTRYEASPTGSNENTNAPGAPVSTTGPTVHPKTENDPPDGLDPYRSWFSSNIPEGLIPKHLQAKPVTTQPDLKGIAPPPHPLTENAGPSTRAAKTEKPGIAGPNKGGEPPRGSALPKKTAAARTVNAFRGKWRTLEQAQQWLKDIKTGHESRLQPTAHATVGVYEVPLDVQKLIVEAMSQRSAVNWALTCKPNYALVDSIRPLGRLPTFLALLPTTQASPNQDMLHLLLDWFDPGKSALSDVLFTPLSARLRQVMTLAVRGAVPDDTWGSTVKIADKALKSLGKSKWTALNDLLDEYVQQHQFVNTDVAAQRLALSRIVPALAQQHGAEDANDPMVEQAWVKLARFLPLITDPTWTLFADGPLVDLKDDGLVHVRLLEQGEIEEWPERSVDEKLACARNCLSDYLGYARIANHLLSQVGKGVLKGPQGYVISNRLNLTRHIVGLSAVLGLNEEDEKALMPPALALLAAEVALLESDSLPLWAADEVRAANTLDSKILPQETSKQLAASMAWRFGRLTKMAVSMRNEQPECLEALRAIARKWPEKQLGYVVSRWFERATSAVT